MSKRIPLSERRANDARGVDVIFGGAPVAPEETANSAEETAPAPPPTPALPPVSPLPSAATASETVAQETPPKAVLAKVTIYIRPEQVIAIESIQLVQRQRTGKKPDKSDLLQEAVDLLIAKYQE